MQVLIVCIEISQSAKTLSPVPQNGKNPGCQASSKHQLVSVTASSCPSIDWAHEFRQNKGVIREANCGVWLRKVEDSPWRVPEGVSANT